MNHLLLRLFTGALASGVGLAMTAKAQDTEEPGFCPGTAKR